MDKKNLKVSLGFMNPSLVDTHRPKPRMKGGNYTPDNTTVLHPIDHMKEHGIYRERVEHFDKLKALMDDRNQLLKLKSKLNNQLLAAKRGTDRMEPVTEKFIKDQVTLIKSEIGKRDRLVKKQLLSYDHPLIQAALDIPYVGPISLATILTYIDIEKAQYASSVWAYVGYHKASHERMKKNMINKDGHKTLRCAMYNLGCTFIKGKNKPNAYYHIYENTKRNLEVSKKITKTRIVGKKGVHEMMWCDVKPSHRHGAALRKMLKHFLADLWYVWRTVEKLPISPLYVESKLGHTGIIRPEERGWKY